MHFNFSPRVEEGSEVSYLLEARVALVIGIDKVLNLSLKKSSGFTKC